MNIFHYEAHISNRRVAGVWLHLTDELVRIRLVTVRIPGRARDYGGRPVTHPLPRGRIIAYRSLLALVRLMEQHAVVGLYLGHRFGERHQAEYGIRKIPQHRLASESTSPTQDRHNGWTTGHMELLHTLTSHLTMG